MSWRVTRRDAFTASVWSGGKTTELYIFPADGSYAERRFAVRVSSATVELEESTFTALPGFRRRIMPLQGQLHLCHENRYDVALAPYAVDTFDGGWSTRSVGRCTDFNVMTAEGWDSSLQTAQAPGAYPCAAITGLYALAAVTVTLPDGQSISLESGDLLLGEGEAEGSQFTLAADGQVAAPAVLFTAWRTGGSV